MSSFVMPSLGADMDEGTLLEWLVKPGDVVHRGDIVAVVDTAKAAVEVESFHNGVVKELVVSPGETVPVGALLARFDDETSAAVTPAEPVAAAVPVRPVAPPVERPLVTSPLVRRLISGRAGGLAGVHPSGPGGVVHRADVPPLEVPDVREQPVPPHAAPELPTPPSGRARISPLARRLAREAGLDLESIHGSGPNGAITAEDVSKATALTSAAASATTTSPAAAVSAPPAPAPAAAAVAPTHHPKMRQTIAALMERANREIPHYYLSTTIDMREATNWLHERNRTLPVEHRLVPAALVMTAIARAARAVPQLNGEWQNGGFVGSDTVNLGLVTSLRGGGVLVPVVDEADTLTVDDMMNAIRSAVQRARTGRLRASELTGASITVTSLGEQGVEAVYGVVFPPQVAIVGVGTVVERPWAHDGMVGVRPVMTVTLAADHRASDGAIGARLLNHVDRLLQHPEEL